MLIFYDASKYWGLNLITLQPTTRYIKNLEPNFNACCCLVIESISVLPSLLRYKNYSLNWDIAKTRMQNKGSIIGSNLDSLMIFICNDLQHPKKSLN